MNALNVMAIRASVDRATAAAHESLERIDLTPVRTLGELVLLRELFSQLVHKVDAELEQELQVLTGGRPR